VSLTVLLHAAQEKENDEWKDLQELMETPEKNRLSIKLDNVRDFDAEMYDDCHNRPSTVIPAYEKAMNDLVRARERTP
jgi:DNA replicative helicase MCM subunit Mcm2 (Cdc46/Mcm family)